MVEQGDEVDKRHSLSYDISTRFNKRPSVDTELTALDDDEVVWQVTTFTQHSKNHNQ